jgi:acetyl-CoA acetyltransferase
MASDVCIVGVGMVPFVKPGTSDTYDVMGEKAARAALGDAGIEYSRVQEAYVGYAYGDSTAGQKALYRVGQSGIPIINVNNNCATGSSALYLARRAILSGAADCVLALGFEQMGSGAVQMHWPDRPTPLDEFDATTTQAQGWDDNAPFAAQYFGGAGLSHMELYGTAPDTFAKIAVKARRHASANPYALFREPITEEQVLASPHIFGPLTRLQCCPPACGAAAAVVCSTDFAKSAGLDTRVTIKAQALSTDTSTTFDGNDMRKLAGYDMTRAAAAKVYESSGVDPRDIPVVELHDCFTTNELITYEGLQLTDEGTAESFVLKGENTYGGQVVTNPSGGLLSKGHPLGATGLAQCAELVWQLRGQAGGRQVEGARHALAHNLGLGGACVVTLYERDH